MRGGLLSALVFMLMIQGPYAGGQTWRAVTDTSYFRSDDDDWNLVESVLRNQPGNLLFLLNRGADPDASAEVGMTALMYAAEMGDSLLVNLLVANGADLELTYVENTTPLLVSVLNRHFGITHYLLLKGADPDHKDAAGGSPLIYAAALNDYRIADLLLYYGAADTITDRDGNTALMTAVFFGNLETVDVLLQNGLSPDRPDNKGYAPLMVAVQQGDTVMINLLLEHGADLQQVDSNHYTALAHAIRFGQLEAAKLLIDQGADVNHEISPDRNLCDLAAMENQNDLLKLLKEKGAEPSRRPEFTVFEAGWGNSFNAMEHMMQVRFTLMDRKYGFFAETGFDFRPVYRKVQVEGEDPYIYQYREFRGSWTHGAGKQFRLLNGPTGVEYGLYGALYGMLSFGSYKGLEKGSGAHYSLVPALGAYMQGRLAGLKAGTEYYRYGTLHEKPWKFNITLYLRIPFRNPVSIDKEIVYEEE
ncbi:MAG: ankyrin repeat domain-containing protein [Bacteroidales bacterium]